ncbi:hypothetical protein H5410_004858 [Solanum commersonii]|uniref:Uncharacterized protein n=1 Tax=Solanum commersonii TaxID=4109 RepID=A0A9J6A5I6_SOLCO|nr:hypothetical protein H5410_004858 [Solanum commersonii]
MGQRQLKERKSEDLRIAEPIRHIPTGPILAFCSSELSLEGKDQIGSEKEQLACHRAVSRSSTILPNDPKHKDAEG